MQRGVPYSEFDKWYRKTHRSVAPVEVVGVPDDEKSQHALSPDLGAKAKLKPDSPMETLEEAKDFIRFLYAQVQEKNSREEMLMQEIASLKKLVSQKEKYTDTINRLLSNIERLMHELSEARAEINRLVSVNSSLVEQISVLKKHRYGSPSQRNRRSKDTEKKDSSENTSQDRDEEKDGFDGTNGIRRINKR